MPFDRLAALEARYGDLERRFAALEVRDIPAVLAVMAERLQVQTATIADMSAALRTVVEQTAESRGSVRTRKAIVAGAVLVITVLGIVAGIALQALGAFG